MYFHIVRSDPDLVKLFGSEFTTLSYIVAKSIYKRVHKVATLVEPSLCSR